MLDFFGESKALGISLSDMIGKAAIVKLEKGLPIVTNFFDIALNDPNVKRLDIPIEALTEEMVIISGLSSDDMLIRPLSVKLTKKKDITSVLPFEAEPLLPFSAEEGILDFMEISKTDNVSNIAVLAVKKESLASHLSELQRVNVDPEFTSSAPVALAVFSKMIEEPSSEEPVLIMHIGEKQTYSVLALSDTPIGVHIIHKGVLHLRDALKKDSPTCDPENTLSTIDFSTLSATDYPELFKTITSIKQEVSRAVLSLAKQHKAQAVSTVFLTGKGATYKGVVSSFSKELKVDISLPPPLFGQPTEVLQEYAIPIGLALDALIHEEPKVNFRKDEFLYKDPWKRLKKPLISFAGFCLFFAFAVYLFGNALAGKRLDQAKQEYANMLKGIEIPYSQFEQNYLTNNPFSEPTTLKDMTSAELKNRINYLENQILQAPDPYKLLPDVPRVSDVLGWLATNPLVTGTKSGAPLLNIKNFQYSLVKKPSDKKKSEMYRVKVEMEFSSDTPKAAREFHDQLIEPNEMVDPKGEVKWSSSGDVYRTSFFLKNRSPKINEEDDA